jgi:hypothetical protein
MKRKSFKFGLPLKRKTLSFNFMLEIFSADRMSKIPDRVVIRAIGVIHTERPEYLVVRSNTNIFIKWNSTTKIARVAECHSKNRLAEAGRMPTGQSAGCTVRIVTKAASLNNPTGRLLRCRSFQKEN